MLNGSFHQQQKTETAFDTSECKMDFPKIIFFFVTSSQKAPSAEAHLFLISFQMILVNANNGFVTEHLNAPTEQV